MWILQALRIYFSEAEIESLNSQTDAISADNYRLSDPDARYNCHSYAWHYYSFSNRKWIPSIDGYLMDSVCTVITDESDIQISDIIVYLDGNNLPTHSGVIIHR